MVNKMQTPPMSEFIDLSSRGKDRRARALAEHGFKPLANTVNVAIYNTLKGHQTLTVRISEDLARKFCLTEGMKMSCFVHPDQTHIALRPVAGRGANLFRPKGSRALVYQTNIKGGTLEPQKTSSGTIERVDDALVITITPS